MMTLVTPHLQVASVLELEKVFLRRMGLRGLLLDMDSTLKDYRVNDFRPEVRAWIAMLRREGIRLCILSNGKPDRIGALAEKLDIPFVAKAFKPLPFGCQTALGKLELRSNEAALVGDQIFADVLAGRLAKLWTILVKPTSTEEPWFTRLKRPFERHVLRWVAPPTVRSSMSVSQSACAVDTNHTLGLQHDAI
jgi:HAD superfamily phosphatase (TIGR01668 family)